MAEPDEQDGLDLSSVIEDVGREAVRVIAEGLWSIEQDQDLNDKFELASSATLRAPRIAERSVRIRAILRSCVPESYRPTLRRFAHRLEEIVRSVYLAVDSRKKR